MLRRIDMTTRQRRAVPRAPQQSRRTPGRQPTSVCLTKGRSMKGVQIPRISAGVIELIVIEALRQYPGSPALSSVRRVIVGSTEVRIELKSDGSRVDSPPE